MNDQYRALFWEHKDSLLKTSLELQLGFGGDDNSRLNNRGKRRLLHCTLNACDPWLAATAHGVLLAFCAAVIQDEIYRGELAQAMTDLATSRYKPTKETSEAMNEQRKAMRP